MRPVCRADWPPLPAGGYFPAGFFHRLVPWRCSADLFREGASRFHALWQSAYKRQLPKRFKCLSAQGNADKAFAGVCVLGVQAG